MNIVPEGVRFFLHAKLIIYNLTGGICDFFILHEQLNYFIKITLHIKKFKL